MIKYLNFFLILLCSCIILALILTILGIGIKKENMINSESLNKQGIMKDNLSNSELVEEIFCNIDNINVNPTVSFEYNELKRKYFDKYNLKFWSCRR